jgi:diamine N-acetyltransferase
MLGKTSVSLRPVTAQNWRACAGLRVEKAQESFVPSNLYSLAEAQFYPDARPLAVFNGADELVGFIMYGRDAESGRWKIFRLMVDVAHQGRGYGTAAMEQVMRDLSSRPDGHEILVCYQDANDVARMLYAKLGFTEQTVEAAKVTALWRAVGSEAG